jgi:hypothetical protein
MDWSREDWIQQIQGDAALATERDRAWLWPLAERRTLPLVQRMALCEYPATVTPDGRRRYWCGTLGCLDAYGRHVCFNHWWSMPDAKEHM